MRLHNALVLSFLVGSLAACMGGKTKPSPAVYDFGLAPPTGTLAVLDVKVQVDEVTATESLNSNRMRYRLNYQNPARVFSYTESRWAALPTEMLSAKIRASSKLADTSLVNCSLKLHLEAFDHVFDSETVSNGIVQLSVNLSDNSTHKIIAGDRFEEAVAATTPDAKGGVLALSQASTAAITKALNWGNAIAEKSAACH